MIDNPYSSSTVDAEVVASGTSATTVSTLKVVARLALVLSQYLGAYLLGIVACMMATPAEWVLAGIPLLPFYIIAALPFFFLWPVLVVNESGELYLPWMWGIALAPFTGELVAFLTKKRAVRVWRPLWIGFPIGFVGSFAVYWAGHLSI